MMPTPSADEVKKYFDTVARDWDTLRQDYYGVEVIDKATAAGLPKDSASRASLVIDVGCGTGFLSAGLALSAEKVIAIDNSPGMLEVARESLQALALHNVDLREGSVDDLPVPDVVADAAFANMVLHHAPEPERMIAEMVRVVKPGGRVVITDMEVHDNEWFRAELADVWLGFTEAQVRRYLESAGLADVEFGWVGTQ